MNPVNEKRKIKLLKALSILLFIATFVFIVFISFNSSASIKNYSGTYVYDSIENQSSCAITLEFYEPVNGDFSVLFYDANESLLYKEECEVTKEDCEVTEESAIYIVNFIVPGEAKRFVIDDYYFSASDSVFSNFAFLDILSYILLAGAGIFLGIASRLKCGSFYFNGQRIIVYVGVTNCYLKVNDVIYDEQKNAGKMGTTLFTCLENGDRIQAIIGRRNRINLTVNDIACPPER